MKPLLLWLRRPRLQLSPTALILAKHRCQQPDCIPKTAYAVACLVDVDSCHRYSGGDFNGLTPCCFRISAVERTSDNPTLRNPKLRWGLHLLRNLN